MRVLIDANFCLRVLLARILAISLVYNFTRHKIAVSLSEDSGFKRLTGHPDVITHFKSEGCGWQTRLNAALRKVAGL